MWVWNYEDILENTNGAMDSLFAFCKMPPGSDDPNAVPGFPGEINILFFNCLGYVQPFNASKREKLRAFIKKAHQYNLQVHFLSGFSAWALPGNPAGYTIMDSVLSFIAASSEEERFDGIQYDVEPYTLPDWYSQELWDSFVELLNYCKNAADASGLNIPFGCAVPFWYDSTPGLDGMKEVIDATDYIAVMDYSDQMANIYSYALSEIQYAAEKNKSVYIGVEVQHGNLEDGITFYQEGWGNLEGALYFVHRNFRDSSSLKGMVIHYYQAYQQFSKWGTKGHDFTYPFIFDSGIKYIADTLNFFLEIVDICGTGVDAAQTLSSTAVLYDGGDGDFTNGNEVTISGAWSVADDRFFYFRPHSVIEENGSYRIRVRPTDSSSNANYLFEYITIPFSVNAIKKSKNTFVEPSENKLKTFPNPFNNKLNIDFETTQTGPLEIHLYNTSGQKIKTIINDTYLPGRYNKTTQIIGLSSGLYFLVMKTNQQILKRKLVLLK